MRGVSHTFNPHRTQSEDRPNRTKGGRSSAFAAYAMLCVVCAMMRTMMIIVTRRPHG